jgi:hypothetical protein
MDSGERHVYLHSHPRQPPPDSHPFSTRGRASSDTIQGFNHVSTAAAQYIQSPSHSTHPSMSLNDRMLVAQPKITVRAEHSSIARSEDRSKKQHLTCMVTVEMPSRYPSVRSKILSAYDGRNLPQEIVPAPPPPKDPSPAPSTPPENDNDRPPSRASTVYSSFAYAPTESIQNASLTTDPFKNVVDDLHTRMLDWKGHSPNDFGRLKMYDYLSVRKDKAVREFLVRSFHPVESHLPGRE